MKRRRRRRKWTKTKCFVDSDSMGFRDATRPRFSVKFTPSFSALGATPTLSTYHPASSSKSEMTTALPDCAPPPRKKARIEPDACTSDPPSYFFDTFPTEVFGNILRYFSRRPLAEDWESHITLRRIIELYSVHRQLGA